MKLSLDDCRRIRARHEELKKHPNRMKIIAAEEGVHHRHVRNICNMDEFEFRRRREIPDPAKRAKLHIQTSRR